MSYQGPALDVPRIFTDLPPAAEAAGFAIEKFGEAAGWPLLALKKAAVKADAPTIYLSSGIHGDEPAGPLALLRLLREKYFDEHHHWLICPVLNPGGLLAKTRHNPGDVDLNRDYRNPQAPETRQHLAFLQRECAGRRFALSILLHEDWETKGYYMYELTRTGQKLIGPSVLAAVDPICGIDHSPVIEGMEAHGGLITRPIEGFEQRPLWPEALWLALNHTDRNVTLEAPSAQDLERRVAAHCAAVRAAVIAADL
jgi:murein peptide amidase A